MWWCDKYIMRQVLEQVLKHSVLDRIMQKPRPFPLQRSSLLALTQGLLFWTPWQIVALWQVAASNSSHLHDPYAVLHQLDAYSMISKLCRLTTACTRILRARNGNDTAALRRTSSYGRSNSTWARTVEQWWGSKTKGHFLGFAFCSIPS